MQNLLFGRVLRDIGESSGILAGQISLNRVRFDLICAGLICSAAGSGVGNRLILREPSSPVARFQRTHGSAAVKNSLTHVI